MAVVTNFALHSKPSTRGTETARVHDTAVPDHILKSLVVLLFVAGTILILDNSGPGPETAPGSRAPTAEVATPSPRELPTIAEVNADRVTVQTFHDALQRELDSLNFQLAASHPQAGPRIRRLMIEKMLRNPGKSGLNDRLAEIDEAMSLSTWPGIDQQHHQAVIEKAYRNIHETAISCRSGALARAGARLGLPPVQ